MDKLRVLNFDIENKPLAYLGPDYTTAEITAIASCWHGHPKSMHVELLGRDDPKTMLVRFVSRYNAADLVVGHYIRGHDLGVVNGALLEYGLPTLQPKLTSDTKCDLVAHKYLSASQENLCETLGIKAAKVNMSNARWREANRLTKPGMALTEARCRGDVLQNIALWRVLVERSLLGPPRVWRP